MLSRILVVCLLIICLGAISLISINAASISSVGPDTYSDVVPSLLNNNWVYLPLVWIIAPPTSTQTPTQTPTLTPTPTTTFTVTTTPSPTLTPGVSDHIVISEFRTLGLLGAEDEFVELYNPTGAPVNIGNWLIRKSNGCGPNISTLVVFYYGTILQPGQHYLTAAYSPYSSIAAADQRFSPGIADNGGLALITSSGTVVDQVGMCAGTYYHEGRPLAPLPVAPLPGTPTPEPGTSDQSYERKPGGDTSCYDTSDNFNDFILISPANPQSQSTGSALCAGVVLITPTFTPSNTGTYTLTLTPTITPGYGNIGSSGQSYHLGTAGRTLYFSQRGQAIFGPALQAGRWYHVAMTSVGNAVTLYLDGEFVASGNIPIDTPAGTQLFIGSLPDDSGKQLNGLVDEVEVVSRALSGTEILAIYSAGHLGKCRPHVLGSPTPTR